MYEPEPCQLSIEKVYTHKPWVCDYCKWPPVSTSHTPPHRKLLTGIYSQIATEGRLFNPRGEIYQHACSRSTATYRTGIAHDRIKPRALALAIYDYCLSRPTPRLCRRSRVKTRPSTTGQPTRFFRPKRQPNQTKTKQTKPKHAGKQPFSSRNRQKQRDQTKKLQRFVF